MESATLLDIAGRRRSSATLLGYRLGRPPRNKGLQYPADPPTVEEIVAVMRAARDDPDGVRLRDVIIVLWRAGLRISEALALTESDLDASRGAVLVRHDKGGKRREVGMDRWAWEQLAAWLMLRATLPVLRPARSDPRTALDAGRRPHSTTPGGGSCPGEAAVRSSSAAPCARCGDVPRRRPPPGDPAPTRTRQSRDHLGLPPRYRQHRDRPHCPRTVSPHDPRPQRAAAALSQRRGRSRPRPTPLGAEPAVAISPPRATGRARVARRASGQGRHEP